MQRRMPIIQNHNSKTKISHPKPSTDLQVPRQRKYRPLKLNDITIIHPPHVISEALQLAPHDGARPLVKNLHVSEQVADGAAGNQARVRDGEDRGADTG